MPSSQKALEAKIAARDRLLAQKDAELVAQAAEILTLKMQCEAQENILSYYNGSCEEMGKLIDDMNGGLVAKLKRILGRHGIQFRPERPPLQ